MERKLAAILAADVVGYSRLMGEDEAGTLSALKTHRKELIDREIADHGGRIVKTTGDGVLVEFPSIVAAVECAVAIQQGMADRNRDVSKERRIELRIGVNLDEVVVDGEDILGVGVNVAARLESFADPGTVCTTGAVVLQVKNRMDVCFEAIVKIKDAIRITPVYPAWYITLLAAAYRDSGEIGKSISMAQHGIRMTPSDRDGRLILCSDYNLVGQQQQAHEIAEQVVSIDPAFSIVKYIESQPYKDQATLRRLIESLREAGLPD